jgi:NADPH:quinone reductase-like Zn-dependent oxidoreductase
MKAAVIHRFGQPPRFESFPDPTPGADEVLVEVRAAGLHPVVKALASGSHYGSGDHLPLVPGIDGVGRLEDGRRVYVGNPLPPYGTMAEQTVVPRSMCIPLPEELDDAAWAGLLNPGMSAWLALTWRARLAPGETVLVLGATGVAGQLAVQLAKQLGAGRVIAAGRDQQVLATLADLGADATVSLDVTDQDLPAVLAAAVAEDAADVVIDYLWGRPTEALIAAISRSGLTHAAPRVRLVEVGDSAGPTITPPAQVLRSSGLELSGGGAGTTPLEAIMAALPQFIDRAASGELRVGVQQVPLAEVETAWQHGQRGRRLVLVP